MHTAWAKPLSYLYCQAAAQEEAHQLSSSGLTGGKPWRKQFLETDQGVLSFALKRNDLQGVLLSRTGWASVSTCKKFTANLNSLMTLYHIKAMHLFALPQKAKEKTPNKTRIFNMGSKVRKQSVWKNFFREGNMYWLSWASHYHMYHKIQDLSGNKKQWTFLGQHKSRFLYLSS